MFPVHLANEMDVAHLPPPTPEDKARMNAALDEIFNRNSNKEQHVMTATACAKEQLDQAVEQSAEVAQELLKADGWAILRQLYLSVAGLIGATQPVMVPVLANLNDILARLPDPTSFDAQLKSVQVDLDNLITALGLLATQHKDKSGEPSLDDIALISTLSLGYSKLQTAMETGIQPLLLGMIQTMQDAGIDTLNWSFADPVTEETK
ncbi:hypothetical protein AVT69_gp074 [Pseudomonas phage PhiPA3]|uniref:Uncharacterized protein 075 n=1 Tax=Pseudomonas phage PhiPA3 TaxID=998086 RepID=F8SJV4_BPPA3|nr:hypothetical protein AVT69_gp074 [Pseudomonas phage PhiPA3]AEH03499.1 hypothetical protein [Pseudomonas phage PhiPA3]